MELIKLLMECVQELPDLAIWILVVIYGYKVAVVGSIYATIRFVTMKVHDIIVAKKAELVPKVKEVDIRGVLEGEVITSDLRYLLAQIRRIHKVRVSISTSYIHGCDIDWLKEAIDEKLAKDAKEKDAPRT
jgi:hypothetical protein